MGWVGDCRVRTKVCLSFEEGREGRKNKTYARLPRAFRFPPFYADVVQGV